MFKKKWKHEITGNDGNCILFGVNIFDYKWSDTKEKVNVADPIYKQNYLFNIYTVCINGKTHKFAAGEYSNCVWGFYLES